MSREYVDGRVSVIIPVYNAARFLPIALESVFSQTYKDIEIVMVDDCSKDNSSDIICKYKEEHPNIIYYLQECNKGAGAARNKALELATGQYVAFLDSDDVWYPEKTARQIELMKKKKSPFGYAAIEMVDEEGCVLKKKRELKEECDYNYLLKSTIIATSSVIIDRTVIGDFKMSLRRGGQDYATWLALLKSGVVACGINEALVKYRIVSGSLSSNKLKSIRQVWEIQSRDEHIDKIRVSFNIVCFVLHALKKYII